MIECVSLKSGEDANAIVPVIHQNRNKSSTSTHKQTPTDRNASVSRARAGCGDTEKNDSWSKVSYVNYFMDFNVSAHVCAQH